MKKFFFHFLNITFLLLTLFTLYKLLAEFERPLNKYEYQWQRLHTDNENLPARVSRLSDSSFFMHSGENKPAVLILKPKIGGLYHFEFSIRKSGRLGDINFTTKYSQKNKSVIVTYKDKPKKIDIWVSGQDEIRIFAEKHGSSAYDHGQVSIRLWPFDFLLKTLLFVGSWFLIWFFLWRLDSVIALVYLVAILAMILGEGLGGGGFMAEFFILWVFIYFFLLLAFRYAWNVWRYVIAVLIYFLFLYYTMLFYYYIEFGVPFSKNALYAILQTNFNETWEFLESVSDQKGLLFLFVQFIMLVLLFTSLKKSRASENNTSKSFFFVSVAMMIFVYSTVLQGSSFDTIKKGCTAYKKELETFLKYEKALLSKKRVVHAECNASKLLVVLVIGESLNRNHMSLYGYFRPTTPNLSQMARYRELIAFEQAYTNFVQTQPALELALTGANQYNHKDFYHTPSLIQVFKAAGFYTAWISNQRLMGDIENFTAMLAKSCDTRYWINHQLASDGNINTMQAPYDMAILPKFRHTLSNLCREKSLVVLHLIGSHVNYALRYPKEYTKFVEKPSVSDFGTVLKERKNIYRHSGINEYDNSAYYNDAVMDALIGTLRKISKPTVLIYLSDHGEDVLRGLAHHPDRLTFEMNPIPLIIWSNEAYKKTYAGKLKQLRGHQKVPWSNDLLYELLLGLADIKTSEYHPAFDLSSSSYALTWQDLLLEHGEKRFNAFSFGKMTIWVEKWRQTGKELIPYGVNSTGAITQVISMGFDKVALPVIFDKGEPKVAKEGHSVVFLLKRYAHNFKKIWLYVLNENDLARLRTVWPRLKSVAPNLCMVKTDNAKLTENDDVCVPFIKVDNLSSSKLSESNLSIPILFEFDNLYRIRR